MILETYNQPWDFELLDTGDGYRLERWNEVILKRPDPQIIWQKTLPEEEWSKAWAIYNNRGKHADDNAEARGSWEIKKAIPKEWILNFQDVKFSLKLSPFKHTGIFAEQAAQWSWALSRIKDKRLRILNLFGYTGGATMVLAKAGAQVTHVDASKPAITWANENFKLNNLPPDSVRWILDDCVKFVKREIKRGGKYDGIIMDPPAFGHSPTGKTWRFNNDLPSLLADCVELLSENAKFLIINGYATNSSALAINNLLEDKIKTRPGRTEFGELCLKHPTGNKISDGAKNPSDSFLPVFLPGGKTSFFSTVIPK